MTFKDILVCLDPTDAGEARLQLAVALARRHQARLDAAYVLPQEIAGAPPYGEVGVSAPTGAAGIAEGTLVAGVPLPGAPPVTTAAPSRAAALADIIEQRFRAAVQPHGVEGDWHLFGPGESEDLVALANVTDLVVCGQTMPDYPPPTGFRAEEIALACGRPLLIVPYAGEFAALGCRVVIAWDGSREAARAVHDALPLIADAEAATVVTVHPRESSLERDRPQLGRLVRHLVRHGIAAQPEQTVRGDLPVADLLLSRAADLGADLIVAGAYHHSQLREALLGGVTRALLDHMTVPVLMSH